MPILYFTSWYNEKNPERRAELITCIINTCTECSYVDKVYLLAECDFPILNPNLEVVLIGKRPTYSDFFEYANSVSKPGDINIFSNIDIYPDEKTICHVGSLDQNQCFALARWDKKPDGSEVLLDRWDAQDVWIFRSPIKKINGNFPMGIPGCDNRIAYEIKAAGYLVTNPAKTLKFFHLHNVPIRNYSLDRKEAIPGPYHLINTSI